MRPRDVRVWLVDALVAGGYARTFVEGLTLTEFQADEMASSAVERKMEILGESLNRVLKARPDLAEQFPDAAGIIGFRNILAHDYDRVSHLLVWSILTESLPPVLDRLESLLEELDDPETFDPRAEEALIPWKVAKREPGMPPRA